MDRRAWISVLLALTLAFFQTAPVIAQVYPTPTLPLAGTEQIPCLQGNVYKGCTTSQIKTYANSSFTASNPFPIGSAAIWQGAGTPPTSLGVGSFGMSGSGEGYVSVLAASSTPTVVQSQVAAGTLTVVLGTAPTPNNYLIASCWNAGGYPAIASGFTAIDTFAIFSNWGTGNGTIYVRTVQRKVQGGDSATETPCTGASRNTSVAMQEVSGLDATFSNSFVSDASAPGPGMSISGTTTSANNLVLMFAGYSAQTNGATSSESGSGWSNFIQANNGTCGLCGAASVNTESQFIAASGGAYASVINFSTNPGYGFGSTSMVLKPSPTPLTTPVRFSKLAVIKNAGAALTPDSVSLNCSTNTACISDASGNVTLTAAGNLFAQTQTVTVANTVTETTVVGTGTGSITIPANYLTAGKTLNIRAVGYHSTVTNPTLRVRVYYGATLIGDTGAVATANSTNAAWQLNFSLAGLTTGVSGTINAGGLWIEAGAGANVFSIVNTSPVTIDTTTSNAINVTMTWGTASASDTITCDYLVLSN